VGASLSPDIIVVMNKELPVVAQYVILAGLWIWWFCTAVYARIQSDQLEPRAKFYELPQEWPMLLVAVPLVLVATGIWLLACVQPQQDSRLQRILYWAIALLTLLGAMVVLIGGWSLTQSRELHVH